MKKTETLEKVINPTSHIAESEHRPRLKSGVRMCRSYKPGGSLYLQNHIGLLEISTPGSREVICHLDGNKTLEAISSLTSVPIEAVEQIVQDLSHAGFIDSHLGKLKLTNRFQSLIPAKSQLAQDQSRDAVYVQLQRRIIPELAQLSWLEGVIDGGVAKLSARQEFGIEIFGSNRLATLMYAILLASGVTNTVFSPSSRRENCLISDSDLGTGILRSVDVGLNYKSRMHELGREIALFPTQKELKYSEPPIRSLRILQDGFPSETYENLMREGLPHLLLHSGPGAALTIGPIVIPGKTPCKRCIALTDEERTGLREEVLFNSSRQQLNSESSVATTYALAGLICTAILEFIDTGQSDLLGAAKQFNYLESLKPAQSTYSRHPRCGCSWE